MATGLGIVVGSQNSVAAVDPDGSGAADGRDYVTISHPTTLQLSADEAPVLGVVHTSPALGRHSKDILLDGFVDRVGDPIGILADDGSIYAGEDLTATAIGCLVDEAAAGLAESPTIVATYPTSWAHYSVDALRDALERAGFSDVTPVPEATAAVRWLDNARGPLADGAVVVYDLGGTTLDISVVRTGDSAGILGKPIRSDDISGVQFDHLTMQHVLASTGAAAAEIDPFDPATEEALGTLRTRCAQAKVSLSTDTDSTVHVELPGLSQQVRLVRDELEDLLRTPIATSVGLVREAVRSAGLDLTDISAVLLVGGGAAIPLVAELVSSELGLPVVAGHRPEHTSAIGAAMLATDLAAASTALAEPVASAAVAVLPRAELAVAPIAAPVSPPKVLPAPRVPVSNEPAKTGISRAKKLAFVAAGAVAITLLAAGGLSLGTGGGSEPQRSNTQTSAPAVPAGVVASSAPAPSSNPEAAAPSDGSAPTTQAGAANPSARPNTGNGPTSQAPAGGVAPAPEAGSNPDPVQPQQPAPNPEPQPQPQQPAPQPQPQVPSPGGETTTTPGTTGGIPGLPNLPTLPGVKVPILQGN